MNEQIVPAITSLITSVDFNREGLDLQGFIDAVKRGEVRKPLTDWIASRGWVTTKLNFSGDFDPVFVGKDWKVLTDTDNGIGIDITKVRFETCLKEDEASTTGEERLIRLKAANHSSLGGKAFRTCWENRTSLPESWKKDENGNIRFIFFDGLVLLNPVGRRFTLYLCWRDGEWRWRYIWLGHDRDARSPSAVLAN